jgi:hypothetical protein
VHRRFVEHRVVEIGNQHLRRRTPQRLVHPARSDLGADSRRSGTLRAQIGR